MSLKKLLIPALVVLAASVLFVLGGAVRANAEQGFRGGENATVAKDETVDSSLFIGGRNVVIAGQINGDVFCAGQSVVITGQVNGDVICAGQTVSISGTVTGSVRAAGQNVTISGKVQTNASVAGQSVTLENNGSVAGDGTFVGSSSLVMGKIGRDLAVAGQDVTLGSQVVRNMTFWGSSATLTKDANVGGNLVYTSEADASLQAGRGQVHGQVQHKQPPREEQTHSSFAAQTGGILYMIVTLLVFALILALIAPQKLHTVTATAIKQPGKVILFGLLGGIVIPIISVVLLFTIVGLPLGLLLGGGWLLVLLLSGPIFAYYLGRQIMRKSEHALIFMTVGSLVLIVLYLLPIINVLTILVVLVMGGGMMVVSFFDNLPKPNYKLKALK